MTGDREHYTRAPSCSKLLQSGAKAPDGGERAVHQEDDPEQSRLLRKCRGRPCSRALHPRDELPPPHSITSSARARSVGGGSPPSLFAVLKFIASSNVACSSTGRSAGFSPRNMRSTKVAARTMLPLRFTP